MLNLLAKLLGHKKHKKGDSRPLIIAHRGARKLAPENTIAAFKKAIKIGFDGVEMDVVLTKDKVPVVFHGNELSHYTHSSGLMHETTSHEVSEIDAGSMFSPQFKGEKIPRLDEVLNLLAPTNMHINIELKGQPRGHKGIEKIAGEVISKYHLGDRVLISSFSPWILKRFSKIYPDIKTALLIGPHPFFFLKTLLSANMLKVKAINPIFQYTSEALMVFADSQGWKVFVWTINTRQEYMRALELGVDGIITDEPDLLRIHT